MHCTTCSSITLHEHIGSQGKVKNWRIAQLCDRLRLRNTCSFIHQIELKIFKGFSISTLVVEISERLTTTVEDRGS